MHNFVFSSMDWSQAISSGLKNAGGKNFPKLRKRHATFNCFKDYGIFETFA